jgi:hypothetical protein
MKNAEAKSEHKISLAPLSTLSTTITAHKGDFIYHKREDKNR